MEFWVTHMEARGKCEGDDGVAALCRALPSALPIATRSAPVLSVGFLCLFYANFAPLSQVFLGSAFRQD